MRVRSTDTSGVTWVGYFVLHAAPVKAGDRTWRGMAVTQPMEPIDPSSDDELTQPMATIPHNPTA